MEKRTVFFTMVMHPATGWTRVGNAYPSRKAAADSLLDRGIGKPLQKAELTGAEGKDLMPTNTAEAARELVTTLAELERLGVIKLPE